MCDCFQVSCYYYYLKLIESAVYSAVALFEFVDLQSMMGTQKEKKIIALE
jgi:hypothetical protein